MTTCNRIVMKKSCPDCGRRVEEHAGDCSHCGFWLESEFIGYLALSFLGVLFLVSFLFIVIWILNQ